MNVNNWKDELNRLLELFEHESTISLERIKQFFKASGRPFNEDFRKYFLKMSTLRLDASFDTVLFDRFDEDHVQMQMQISTSGSDDVNRYELLDASGNLASMQLKFENDVNLPIEIVDSDDGEKNIADEQQIQATNCSTTEDPQLESNATPNHGNDDNIISDRSDAEFSGTDMNQANEAEVHVKRELKIEHEKVEMIDLPLVEFDPSKDADNSSRDDSLNAQRLITQCRPNSSSDAKKLSKRNAAKSFKCKECAYASQYKHVLKRHQLIHEGVKPFKCDHCDYTARSKGDINKHQRIHARQKLMGLAQGSNDGVYECPRCDQHFVKWYSLQLHMTKSHKNNQRLFNCSRCMRGFPQKNEKCRHEAQCQMRHYGCYLCKDYIASRLSSMKQHMRIHSGAKPFKCAICNKYFRAKSNLGKHLNSVHSRNYI